MWQRVSGWLARLFDVQWLRGAPGEEAAAFRGFRSGTDLDKPWGELLQEFGDARAAWRQNPLARRLIGLTTAYVVGNGFQVQAEYGPLDRFIQEFWSTNRMDLRLDEWSDELARSGELFPVLFPNSAGGVPVVRTRPAAVIREVQWRPGDYETETAYIEERHGMDEHVWRSPATATGDEPVMLHYAVNRPVGAVRGESDLAPILPWLRRYSRWLEDRVRLNAAVRSFLWIVKAPERLHRQLAEKYTSPPTAGSVVISHPDEEWSAVAPTLHASDASHDGRAIRWMIVAGGPGTALLDLGEGEDSNLATGKAMAEQRRRFLRRRQAYITWMVADLLLHAYRMQEGLGTRKGRRQVTHADIVVDAPDISPEDNQQLAQAATQLAGGLVDLAGLLGQGAAYRRMALRLFAKFLGEELGPAEVEQILGEGREDGGESDGASGTEKDEEAGE